MKLSPGAVIITLLLVGLLSGRCNSTSLKCSNSCACCMNGTVYSHPRYGVDPYDAGMEYHCCISIPEATINVLVTFEILEIGDRYKSIPDDGCHATGALTDIDHVRIRNGDVLLFYCGGVSIDVPKPIQFSIRSPENFLDFSLNTSETKSSSNRGYKITYELTFCPDIDGGKITRLNKTDDYFRFNISCLENMEGDDGTYICDEYNGGVWIPRKPSCRPIPTTTQGTTTPNTTMVTVSKVTQPSATIVDKQCTFTGTETHGASNNKVVTIMVGVTLSLVVLGIVAGVAACCYFRKRFDTLQRGKKKDEVNMDEYTELPFSEEETK